MQWLSSTLGRKTSGTQQPQQQQQQQPHNPVVEEEEDQHQYEHDHDHDEYDDYDEGEYDHDEYGHDHGDDGDEYVDDDGQPGVGRPGPTPHGVGPPPSTGPPISSSSSTTATTPPRKLSDLTRPQRPIDPVFRSGVQYAIFSKGGGGGQPSHQAPSLQSTSINVFIPSSKVAAAPASSRDDVMDEEETENNDDDDDEGGESMLQQQQKPQLEENPMEVGDTYYGDGDDNAPPVGPGTETETEMFEQQKQEGDHYYYHHYNHDEIGPTAEEDDGNSNSNNYYNGQHPDPDQNQNQYYDQQYDESMGEGGDRDVLGEEGGGTYEASNGLSLEFDVSQQPGQAQGYNTNEEEEGYYGVNDGDGGPDDDMEGNNRGDHYISDDGTDDDDDHDKYEYDGDVVDRSMVEYSDENGQDNNGGSENIVAVPEEDADVNPPSTPAAAAGDNPSTSYETPSRFQQQQQEGRIAVEGEKPTPSSRFVFLSDQKRLPTDLRRLQERTLKRRRELLTRMHDLDCQAARLASQLADEQMDFHLAIHDSFERTVQRPLTSAMERITIDKDSSSNPMIVRSLERRLCDIDVGMTRHVHETMCEAKRDKLESIHDGLQQGIVSELRMENIKYDKVEGGIVRRFEQVAGSLASDFQKEAAERRGQTELLRRKVELTAKVEATERLQHKLVLIQSLREQLKSERAERRQSDQRIHTEINESKVRIERAMLAAFETEL